MRLKKLACIAMMSVMATGLVACGSDNNKGTEAGTGAGSAQTQSTAATKAENDNTPFVEEPDTAPYEEFETNKSGMVVKGSDLRVIYDLDDYPASFWDAKNKYSSYTNREVAERTYKIEYGKEFGVLSPSCEEYSTYKKVDDVGYKLTLKSGGFLYMNALEEGESECIEVHVLLNDCNFFDVEIGLTKVKEDRFEKEFGAVDGEVDGWTMHKTSGSPILVKKLDTKSGVITVLTVELSANGSRHSMQVMRQSRCIELVKKVKDCITIEKLDYIPDIDYIDVKDVDETSIKISDKVSVTVPEEFKMMNWCRIDKGATQIGLPGFGGRNYIRFRKANKTAYELSYITIVEIDGEMVGSIEEELKNKKVTDVSSDGVKMYETNTDDGSFKSHVRYIEANDTIYVVSCEIANYDKYPETNAMFDDICKNLVKIN